MVITAMMGIIRMLIVDPDKKSVWDNISSLATTSNIWNMSPINAMCLVQIRTAGGRCFDLTRNP
jgi:hypothetical protein